MTSQEGSSLLKSCARRSFSFTCGNLQGFATHPHSLGDPWFEKHCVKESLKWTGDRYEVSIPWKLNLAILPSNYEMALKRLKNIEKRLLKEHDLGLSYCNLITSYIERLYFKSQKRMCLKFATMVAATFPCIKT